VQLTTARLLVKIREGALRVLHSAITEGDMHLISSGCLDALFNVVTELLQTESFTKAKKDPAAKKQEKQSAPSFVVDQNVLQRLTDVCLCCQ
jgi:hypothetical protein